MLQRINLIMLLGIIAVVVLSFGLVAGAAQEEGSAAEEVPSGDAEEAQGELERLQWEVQAAHGARLNAEDKKQQIADDVADTQNELASAREYSEEARQELADTASEVYREGGFGDLLGVLVGAESLGGFAERLDLAARLLEGKQEAVEEAGKAEENLANELEERSDWLEEWQNTGVEQQALEQQILDAEAAVQAQLDDLPEEVREEIETGREQQAELDQARGEEILEGLEAAESSVVSGGESVPSATEKLVELRDLEQAAEIVVTEKALEAEQARLAAEQAMQQPIAVEAPAAPAEEIPAGPDVDQAATQTSEQAVLEDAAQAAQQAVVEAEQAATQAAERAEAAEQARQVAEREVVVERVAPQLAVKEAERQAAGQSPDVSNDGNGVADAGDRLRVEGDFSIRPGATVTFEDADGTRGTAIDGLNANIIEGSIETDLLGSLENVAGGDGVLDTTGDLGIVDTTGITSPGVLDAGLPYDPTLGPGPILGDLPGAARIQYDPIIGADPIVPIPGAIPSGPTVGQYDPDIGVVQPVLGVGRGQLGKGIGGMLMEEKPNSPASGQPGLKPGGSAPRAGGGPASGSAIVREAMSWLGTPYSFGGTGRDGISCSGLTLMAYQKFGISLPNSPGGQLGAVGNLNSGSAPAGAIVFFSEDGSGTPTHLGISNGDGTMTDANIVKGQVGITPIDIVTGYMGWGFPAGM